jgi:hypothetical protein
MKTGTMTYLFPYRGCSQWPLLGDNHRSLSFWSQGPQKSENQGKTLGKTMKTRKFI